MELYNFLKYNVIIHKLIYYQILNLWINNLFYIEYEKFENIYNF